MDELENKKHFEEEAERISETVFKNKTPHCRV